VHGADRRAGGLAVQVGEGLIEFLVEGAGELLGRHVPDSGANVALCLALAGRLALRTPPTLGARRHKPSIAGLFTY